MNKRCKAILKAFKAANPDLVALSPKIIVDEMLGIAGSDYPEPIEYDPPIPQITVTHNFIFDNRLIPTEFQGIEICNITLCISFPSEFPDPGYYGQPIEEYYAPERYIAFVKRMLPEIRKKLKKPDLSEAEALEAITGGWKKHLKWCKQQAKKRLAETG